MKTSLEKGIDYLDDERIDIFYITYDCKKQREYIEHAIKIALQDFADKVEKWLINTEFDFEEHILTYEFPKLKKNEGLK